MNNNKNTNKWWEEDAFEDFLAGSITSFIAACSFV
jgi:hypothetical protein